jgi:hypothetical protein
MAKPDAMKPKKPEPFAAIKAEVDRRKVKAKREKEQFREDFREAYSFVMPQRLKPGDSKTSTRPKDSTDNFSTLGEEVCTDFASDMADTFVPEHTRWAGVEVTPGFPEEMMSDARIAAKKDTDATFAAIIASNFHETSKQSFKDLAVSAVGLSIIDPGRSDTIRCQVIPIGELLILRDGAGNIGTRFWERDLIGLDIQELFPDLDLPDTVKAAIDKKDTNNKFCVLQGCYRDYSVPGETAWIQFTQIDGDVCEGVRKKGVGSANILVARWDPDPNFAWGNGPAMKAAADFRELDETNYLKLKGLARQVDPSIAYDDDSVMNLDGGLPNGVAIPRMKGSKIDVIESTHDMQAAMFAVDAIEERVRRHFYQDGPVQKGKTPPTLGQWADESLQKQRRLGTPAAPLWQEFIMEAYMRFRWLLVTRGELQPEIIVGSKSFPVRPINPLKRAAKQQEAVASERLLQTIAGTFGPNLLPMIVDVGETANKLAESTDASCVKMQTAATINQSIKDAQQAQMAQQAAASAGPLLKAGAGQ